MPAANTDDFRSLLCFDRGTQITATTFTTTAVDAGWCARITAPNNKQPATVWVNYQTATAPVGTVEVRIETVDASNGKPTGTLYHANATATFSPVAGWNGITFASLPAAWVAGTEYAVVLRTTAAGTSNILRASVNLGSFPTATLTTATASTRSSFTETGQPMPIFTVTYSDGEEDPLQCCQYAVATNYNIAGTAGYGAKFTIVDTITTDGVEASMIKSGTPAGDLRIRLLDVANNVVATDLVSRGSLSALSSTVNCKFTWDAITTIAPGTYRIVMDSSAGAVGNCFRIRTGTARIPALCSGSFRLTSCPDVSSPVWTDSTVELAAIALRTTNRAAPSAGSGVSLARVAAA